VEGTGEQDEYRENPKAILHYQKSIRHPMERWEENVRL
jgi:hypothetical protein